MWINNSVSPSLKSATTKRKKNDFTISFDVKQMILADLSLKKKREYPADTPFSRA